MEPITSRLLGHSITQSISQRIEQLIWETQRIARAFTHRWGVFGWLFLCILAILLFTWVIELNQQAAVQRLQDQIVQQKVLQHEPVKPIAILQEDVANPSKVRAQLGRFESHLTAQSQIPIIIENLLRLAEKQHVVIKRGEYHLQTESAGKFLRYRMTFPVRGDSLAINRFIEIALFQEKSLALESIQFKRKTIETSDLEANIQWVLLTQLPVAQHGVTQDMTAQSDVRDDHH